MADLILHHYDGSPFAEKIRLILGFKKLKWQSVIIPLIMPKPDLVALTGGYRKTPVLQIGADVYCDTALIARVLEQLRPTPSLYPNAHAASASLIAAWADSTFFGIGVTYAMQPGGAQSLFAGAPPEQLAAFAADRKEFRKNATTPRPSLELATVALRARLAELEIQLTDARTFVLGNEATIADFSLYHPLWFIARATAVAGILSEYPRVSAWMARVATFGHGDPQKLDSRAALDIASQAAPAAPAASIADPLLGKSVSIAPTDYGIDPVAGELVGSAADEWIVARSDVHAGRLHVHFPKQGFATQTL